MVTEVTATFVHISAKKCDLDLLTDRLFHVGSGPRRIFVDIDVVEKLISTLSPVT